MLVGILEMRHTIQEHTRLYLFSIFVILTWLIWMLKIALSRRYRPWTAAYVTRTSVVIPVVDEPLDLFRSVLRNIMAQSPTQIMVVINGPRNRDLEGVCDEFAPDVEWTWTPIAGKRNAVRVGVEQSFGDVVVLVDSDTVWTPGHARRTGQAVRRPERRRRHHPAADPRTATRTSSPAGPTGWRTAGRCTRCRPRACSARSAVCPAGRSRSGAAFWSRPWTRSCTRSSSACSSRCPTTGPSRT